MGNLCKVKKEQSTRFKICREGDSGWLPGCAASVDAHIEKDVVRHIPKDGSYISYIGNSNIVGTSPAGTVVHSLIFFL